MGIILFWTTYVVAAICLYTILFSSYQKKEVERLSQKGGWLSYEYEETNERKKHPLWMIICFIIVFFIPLFNCVIFGGYIMIVSTNPTSLVYFKSFLTKEY